LFIKKIGESLELIQR